MSEDTTELGPGAQDRKDRLKEINKRRAQATFEHTVETKGGVGGFVDTRAEAVQEQTDRSGLEDTLEKHESPEDRFKRLTES